MSSNRPFLTNFLAAFRAQSAYKAAKPPSPGPQTSLSPSHVGSTGSTSNSRSITSKSGTGSRSSSTNPQQSTTAAVAASASNHFSSHHHHHHGNRHHHQNSHAQTHSGSHSPSNTRSQARSPLTPTANTTLGNSGANVSSPVTGSSPIPVPRNRHRRGSDSSSGSGGFRDALGSEKWYIGGRTGTGEEKLYPLGMVTKGGGRLNTRVGSFDQLSL